MTTTGSKPDLQGGLCPVVTGHASAGRYPYLARNLIAAALLQRPGRYPGGESSPDAESKVI